MSSQEEKSCPEKPGAVGEKREEKTVMVTLAFALGITILVAGMLDLLAKGIPLGFVIPILNQNATISNIVYHVVVIAAAVYIGAIGIKELVVERRFSVEFLMAVAALGAIYLNYLFEAAMVLLLYCIAEYLEGYIQERARKDS